jgi:hypothetical protein
MDRHRGHAIEWVRQTFCGLHGHDTLLQFEQDRMFLKCVSCGHETPGWALNEPRPITMEVAELRRPVQLRPQPQLLAERRVA